MSDMEISRSFFFVLMCLINKSENKENVCLHIILNVDFVLLETVQFQEKFMPKSSNFIFYLKMSDCTFV